MGKYDRPGNQQVKIDRIKSEILKVAKAVVHNR